MVPRFATRLIRYREPRHDSARGPSLVMQGSPCQTGPPLAAAESHELSEAALSRELHVDLRRVFARRVERVPLMHVYRRRSSRCHSSDRSDYLVPASRVTTDKIMQRPQTIRCVDRSRTDRVPRRRTVARKRVSVGVAPRRRVGWSALRDERRRVRVDGGATPQRCRVRSAKFRSFFAVTVHRSTSIEVIQLRTPSESGGVTTCTGKRVRSPSVSACEATACPFQPGLTYS